MTINLRQLNDGDISLMKTWLKEPHVAMWYEHPDSWLYELANRHGQFSWIHHFIVESDGEPIGFCQHYEYAKSGEDWHGNLDISGAYSIDYLIGKPDYIGKGLGRELILLLLEQISTCHDARLVIVQPDEKNKASQAALLSAGFTFDAENRLFKLDL